MLGSDARVLISIRNSVNIHSELAGWPISNLQWDDLQTPGDNATIAAQSWVIRQLRLPDDTQIIPERSFSTCEKLMKISTFSKFQLNIQ